MDEKVLEIKGIHKTFVTKTAVNHAVNGVSFTVHRGEALGLVGESGCGKSTLAKIISRLIPADEGSVTLCGEEISVSDRKARKDACRRMQMVFQDPQTSFDPRIPLGKSIAEVYRHHKKCGKKEAEDATVALLEQVGLSAAYAGFRPTAVSGGECQRAAIARAIAIEPKLLICDEATSALDVSVQAQIVSLLKRLGEELDMSFLFISHDLSLVCGFCHRIAVMYRGKTVEMASSAELLKNPRHPYTKLLLSSVFPIGSDEAWSLPEIPDSVENLSEQGCVFGHRCGEGASCPCGVGQQEEPEWREIAPDHFCACMK